MYRIALLVGMTAVGCSAPVDEGAPGRRPLSAHGEDGVEASGLAGVEAERIILSMHNWEAEAATAEVPAVQLDDSTVELQFADRVATVRLDSEREWTLFFDDGPVTIRFPEGLPTGPAGAEPLGMDPSRETQVAPLLALMGVSAIAGLAMTATCGYLAPRSCGNRGVAKWGVYSWEDGLCYVECHE